MGDYVIDTFVFLDQNRGWKLIGTEHILAGNSFDALRSVSNRYSDNQYFHEVRVELPVFQNTQKNNV